MYSVRPFSKLIEEKNDKELIFIHTPKCGGTYVISIISHFNIKNYGHQQANLDDKKIYFTVIRDPVDRFESLLNYRLSLVRPRNDWPESLKEIYNNKSIELDEIVRQMTDEEILGFSPFRTISYYTKNVDIIITLENLPKLLEYFGHTYDINSFKSVNVSRKTRGKIKEEQRNRIKRLFNEDNEIYEKVINSSFDI